MVLCGVIVVIPMTMFRVQNASEFDFLTLMVGYIIFRPIFVVAIVVNGWGRVVNVTDLRISERKFAGVNRFGTSFGKPIFVHPRSDREY